MIVTTIEIIPGYEIKEVLGIVSGNIVKSKHIGRDIGAALKTIIGGEIKGYTDLLTESRNEAYARMVKEGEDLGADAIIGFRYASSQVMSGASEMLAYGTAVRVAKK